MLDDFRRREVAATLLSIYRRKQAACAPDESCCTLSSVQDSQEPVGHEQQVTPEPHTAVPEPTF